jgi:hypothetical protein
VPHQLNLWEGPAPESSLWEGLNEEQRTTVIDTMARVIRKAAVAMTHGTDSSNREIATIVVPTRGPQERADG